MTNTLRTLFLFTLCTIVFSVKSNCQNVAESFDSVSAKKQSVAKDDKVFNKVEFEAEFPGGNAAWSEYLQNNLRAQIPARKGAPVGTYTVIVRFIVSVTGEITGVSTETNYGYGMEKEVMRIINKSPKWNPAIQNGHPVNAYRRQPITFVVSY